MKKQAKYNRDQTGIGRTITAIHIYGSKMAIHLDDDTFMYIEASENYDSLSYDDKIRITNSVSWYSNDPDELEGLGLISKVELEKLLLIKKEKEKVRQEEYDRAKYEELKKKFEPDSTPIIPKDGQAIIEKANDILQSAIVKANKVLSQK